MSESIPSNVAAELDVTVPVVPEAAPFAAGYKVYHPDPDTRIAVAKVNGALWDGRIKAGVRSRQIHLDAADEAVRYYNNDQSTHRNGAGPDRAGNTYFSAKRNKVLSETENIVYANARAIVPAIYAKNPQGSFSTENDADKQWIGAVQKLVNRLCSMPDAPGINLATHGKQCVLAAEVTNLGWLEIGYTERGVSTDGVRDELQQLSEKLAAAKEEKELRELEGQIMALEEMLDVFQPAGPFVRYRYMRDVVVDPEAMNPDFSDARWMAIEESYPTAYLNAKYGEKGEDGIVRSVYMPTEVLTADTKDDNLDNFRLFQANETAQQYGYSTQGALNKAHRTKCWRIFDRVTRRVYLYADNKWDWPVWAASDPYGLPQFFPLYPLAFNNTIVGAYARSNVTYYLDQQDGINEINDEMRRARQGVREALLIDNRFARDTVEKWLKGGDTAPLAVSVEVPEGMNLKDMVLEKPNVMAKMMPFFDPTRLMSSIDRVSGVSEVLRGAQFKTNTTKYAVENYNSTTATRMDEKIDAIENWSGRVLHGIAFLCIQFMPTQQVAQIIGQEDAQHWQMMNAAELRHRFQCSVVGGSTQKPTSTSKKQQALDIAKVLGTFGQFAPSVVMEIVLQMMQEAFDEVILPDGAFERIMAEAKQAMGRGMSTGGQPGASPDGPQQGGSDGDPLQDIAVVVNALPPEAKKALGEALAQGAPVEEVLPAIIEMVQQAPQ